MRNKEYFRLIYVNCVLRSISQADKDLPMIGPMTREYSYKRIDRRTELIEQYQKEDLSARIIQRAVKKYIYGKGMSGESRSMDSFKHQHRINLRKKVFLLANRMTSDDMAEILKNYGGKYNL